MMSQAKDGDQVKVHYTGKLTDGTVFDTSEGKPPFEFKIGTNSVIPGFELAVKGMAVGDEKTVTVKSDEGYGPVRDELIATVNKSAFPENIEPAVGRQLQMEQPGGKTINVTVAKIDGEEVTLDANHPLAGKDLTFDIKLVEIA
jgi:FKBP-type peptidyl-prolyl cis-trans isomerase 2